VKLQLAKLLVASVISVSAATASEKELPPLQEVYTSANRDTGLPYLAVRCAGYFGAVLYDQTHDESNTAFIKDMLKARIADLIEYAIQLRTFGMPDAEATSETEKIHQEMVGFVDAYNEIMAQNLQLFGSRTPDGSGIASDQALCVSFSVTL